MVQKTQISIPSGQLADFCRRHHIRKLMLFGSVLRSDFGPESDVDLMVTVADDARCSLFDMVRMQDELRDMLGRDVDLVTRRAIERSLNPIRREAILSSAEPVYVEG